MIAVARRLVPDRFILLLIATVGLASAAPARAGFATAVDLVTTAAIVLLFFLHGLRLPRQAVIEAVTHWRLHLVILGSTFLLFPLLGLALARLVPGLLPPPLWLGMLFLCAVPSTVQSSIAFTAMAGGNVAAAVAAAAASNLLGVMLTPLLLGLLTDAHGAPVSLSGIGTLLLELVAPFLVGHLSRPLLAAWAERRRKLLGVADRAVIVLAVYSAFSAAVVGGIWTQLDSRHLIALLGLCAVLLGMVLAVTSAGAALLGFSREDRIAITFVGSKKTLASGVPMARVLFSGPAMGAAVLPLMIFHQLQLMVCAWLARRYANVRSPNGS